MTDDARELRYIRQTRRERRGYFTVAGSYAVLVVGIVVYQLVRGRPFEDVAPESILWLILIGLFLLLVVKYRDSAGVADDNGIRGFAHKDIPWPEVAAITIREDACVAVLTDETERRTRFPASYAQQLADLGNKPLR